MNLIEMYIIFIAPLYNLQWDSVYTFTTNFRYKVNSKYSPSKNVESGKFKIRTQTPN